MAAFKPQDPGFESRVPFRSDLTQQHGVLHERSVVASVSGLAKDADPVRGLKATIENR